MNRSLCYLLLVLRAVTGIPGRRAPSFAIIEVRNYLMPYHGFGAKILCKHETVLGKYIPTVNVDPSKIQSLIILSLICTSLSCGTVVVFISLITTSLLDTPFLNDRLLLFGTIVVYCRLLWPVCL